MTLSRRVLLSACLLSSLALSACGPGSSGFCGSRVFTPTPIAPSTDAGHVAFESQRVQLQLNVPAPLSSCDQGVPERAEARVSDPAGDRLTVDENFVAGPAEYPGRGYATVGFTPTRPGWHQVTVQFEPSWGTALAVVYVMAKPKPVEEDLPLAAGVKCDNLQQTSSGVWLCGSRVLAPDGGGQLLDGKTHVAGNTVWAYGATAIRAYDAADGGLTLSGMVQRSTSPTDSVLATEAELWSLVRGGPLAERYSLSDAGVARTAVLDAGVRANSSPRPELLYVKDDLLFVAEAQLSAPSTTTGPEFQACSVSITQPDAVRECHVFTGRLVGWGQGGVYSYADAERTLRFFTPEGSVLMPRNNVNAPAGLTLKSTLNGSRISPVFSHESLDDGPSYLITPVVRGTEGLLLEHYDLDGGTSGGANDRFIWAHSAETQRLLVWRRAQ